MKRKHLFLVAVIAIVALLVVAVVRQRATDAPVGVRVVALLSLTGPAARFDAIKQQALELAVERVNAAQTTLRMSLEVLDAGASPDATQAAARRALDANASYILTGTSPNALAVATLVRGRTPPVVQIANAANPNFGPPRVGEYRFWPDWNQEAQIVTDMLRANGLGSVLIIHSADPYSEALTTAFRSRALNSPEIAVRSQQYDPAATPDFRPLLLRAKSEGIAALVVFGLPPGITALMGQLADVGWSAPLIGGVNTTLAADAFDKAGLKSPLWVVKTEAMADVLPAGSEAEGFRRAFTARTGTTPPFHALYLADGVYFAASAQRLVQPGDSPTEAAGKVRTFDGPSGTINVSEDGVLQFVMTIARVR